MAAFSNPNVSTPDIIAGNYAQANLQNQQANLLVPAQAQQALSSVELNKANAGLATAQTGLVGAQTTGANITNQINQIDLNTRRASMTAFRQAYSEANGVPTTGMPAAPAQDQTTVPQGQAPAQPAEGQASGAPTAVGPDTPVTAVQSPDAQARAQATKAAGAQVNQADADAVAKHAAATPYTSNGTPNTLSTDFLARVRDLTIANGGDPVAANTAYTTGIKTGLDISKQYAEVFKQQQDGQISAAQAQDAHIAATNNLAHQAQVLLGSNPAQAQGIATALGIDLSTNAGQAQLKAMSDNSPQGQKEQAQANENANIANEITNRNAQTKIAMGQLQVAQIKAQIEQGQLDVAKANQQIAQLNQGMEVTKLAAGSAQLVNSSRQTQDDIGMLQPLIAQGAVTQKGGAYYVAATTLPPDIKHNLISMGAKMDVPTQTLDISNILSRVKANTTELKAQALSSGGAAGAAASDSRLNAVTESAGGKGLDISQPASVILNSLAVAKTFAGQMEIQAAQQNKTYNGILQQSPTGAFTPIQPTYQKRVAPQEGDIFGGKAFTQGQYR